jgi:hypothetical protein
LEQARTPIGVPYRQPLELGSMGVYIAVPVSLLAMWSGVLFKVGRWKEQGI